MASWLRIRLGFVFIAFLTFFLFVAFRLIQLQVLPNQALEDLGTRQYKKNTKKPSSRIAIIDRNGEELAISSPAGSVYARPKLIRAKRKTARILSKTLGGSSEKWLAKITDKKPFVWLQRKVREDVAKELAAQNIPGVFIETESKRIYPNGNLAAQLLGFTDVDGVGISGLEHKQNSDLLDGSSDGSKGLQLTLDRRIQFIVEEELENAMATTKAKGVMAMVVDPYNGEVFAMGQRPTFDPNFPRQSSQSAHLNHFISSLYEPGSTMKVLLAAEAIQNGLLTKDSLVDCGYGKLQIGNKTIREAESDHQYGRIPLSKVIQFSSNVGAARVGEVLGAERVRTAIEKFGLISKTGIALSGETTGVAKPDSVWKPIFLATASFGQGISVTPLQMTMSFAPFANGGYLVRPKILKRELDEQQGEQIEVRRVLSPKTVMIMKDILVGVTEAKDGTGVNARIPEIRVAGKTGTAQKYEAGTGYEGKKYFSSFIGFLPADRPQLLISVMVDEPGFPYYASTVAAPVFKKIAERSLQILDKNPKQLIEKKATEQIIAMKKKKEPAVIKAEIPKQLNDSGAWVMPDLKGKSMKEVLLELGEHQSQIKFSGSGFLESQEPAAGAKIEPTTSVVLTFAPAGG